MGNGGGGHVFGYGLLAVPEIVFKRYCEVFLSKLSVQTVLNKTCCELNPSNSVIPAVTHKHYTFVNYYI